MVRKPTEIQEKEEYDTGSILRLFASKESRGKLQLMDAQNKWNGARKLMKKAEFLRVSSTATG